MCEIAHGCLDGTQRRRRRISVVGLRETIPVTRRRGKKWLLENAVQGLVKQLVTFVKAAGVRRGGAANEHKEDEEAPKGAPEVLCHL